MQTFIEDVLSHLQDSQINFANVVFILPSKRAGIFLKNKLSNYINKTSFAPKITSIEDFIDEVSQLKQVSGIELLFKFYTSYKKLTPEKELEPFDSFAKWSQLILQDFNEIDRYYISPKEVFDYMSATEVMKRWSVDSSSNTNIITEHISFWEKISDYYYQLQKDLIAENKGYQGLLYRKAADNIKIYSKSTNKHHVFVGFNALNTSEEYMIKALLANNSGEIFWDLDKVYFNNSNHSAGLFARRYKEWDYYTNNAFQWLNNYYSNDKNIEVIACPKNISQSKYAGHLLKQLNQNESLKDTAVILGDENLLIPLLNSIPEGIDSINITMGLPLRSIPLASLFEQLFTIHKLKKETYYYRDVFKLLSNQTLQNVFEESQMVINYIQKNNITQVSKNDLISLLTDKHQLIELLFGDWHSSTSVNIQKCLDIIEILRLNLSEHKSQNRIELEYLYRFNVLFNEISSLNTSYNYIKDVASLFMVYKEFLNSETLDFQGEPLQGLQIMGMLESRVLDFETVIITSVNEGILPGGKTNNSFIPFDFKVDKALPTFREKDAIYTYHFYSLIQRAKNVFLLYNTEVDALKGGEKSRFITQLDIENIHNIKYKIARPFIPKIEEKLIKISKNHSILEKLKAIAGQGFSPSSLTNYIRNPLDFYYEKVLGIKTTEEVEETVAYNTLGTIVHNTLEDFYKPFENMFLEMSNIKTMKSSIDKTVKFHFQKEYKKGDISNGKNLIIFEIAKRYISNFLDSEMDLLKSGNQLKIIAIESNNEVEIDIRELNFLVKLKGKIDRIDELNGITRIIDYKSGKVEQNKVEIIDWEDITTDYDKYSKSFQVLAYVYMMQKENKISLPVEAGIISFKNLQNGFLRFAKKESPRGKRDYIITHEVLTHFEKELKKLILEICDPKIDFIEKQID